MEAELIRLHHQNVNASNNDNIQTKMLIEIAAQLAKLNDKFALFLLTTAIDVEYNESESENSEELTNSNEENVENGN